MKFIKHKTYKSLWGSRVWQECVWNWYKKQSFPMLVSFIQWLRCLKQSICTTLALPVYLNWSLTEPQSTTKMNVRKVIHQNSAMKFMVGDLKEHNRFFLNLTDSHIIFFNLTMYNILLEPIKILPGWFRDADCFKNCSKMACFSTDHLAIWVQRSLVEWPIKGPLCHFICLSLPSTQDHNKKLNSSKEDKVVKVKWQNNAMLWW